MTLSYRRGVFDEQAIKYWLLPELRSLIKHQHITFYPCTQPKSIEPDKVTLMPTRQTATCDTCKNQPREPFTIETDFVLAMTGYVMDTTLLEQAGVKLEGESRAPQIDMDTMMTNVPGLYVAGTAVAGTQVRFRLFIENCHPHVTRIAKHITGQNPPPGLVNDVTKTLELPES